MLICALLVDLVGSVLPQAGLSWSSCGLTIEKGGSIKFTLFNFKIEENTGQHHERA